MIIINTIIPFAADSLLEPLTGFCVWAGDFLPVPDRSVWLPLRLDGMDLVCVGDCRPALDTSGLACKGLVCLGEFRSVLLLIFFCSSLYAWGILTCVGTNRLMADSWSGEIEELFLDVCRSSCLFCLSLSKLEGFTELSWFSALLTEIFWNPSLRFGLLSWDFRFFLGWIEFDVFETDEAPLIKERKQNYKLCIVLRKCLMLVLHFEVFWFLYILVW